MAPKTRGEDSVETGEGKGRSGRKGQGLVLYALMLIPICLMLGLIIDFGYAYGQKRLTQDLADNAALAGSQVVGKSIIGTAGITNASVVSAICDIAGNSAGAFNNNDTAAFKNATFCNGSGTAEGLAVALSATYLDAGGNPIAGGTVISNTSPIPGSAYGVLLTASESSPTFFAKVGGVNSIGVQSHAAALTGAGLTSFNTNSPNYLNFAVWLGDPFTCQQGLDCVGLGKTVTFRDNHWCRDVAVGNNANDCKANPSWKGVLPSGSGNVSVGDWTPYDTGNKTGWWNATLTYDCEHGIPVIVPVIDNVDPSTGKVHIAGFVAILADPTKCGAIGSSPDTGKIVAFSPQGGGGIGGPTPVPGIPSVRPVQLVQ